MGKKNKIYRWIIRHVFNNHWKYKSKNNWIFFGRHRRGSTVNPTSK